MVTITLKGREIPLLYTTWEMKQVQEELGPISTAIKKVLGRNPEDENDMSLYAGAEHLAAAATLIRILGNAGLEESGEAADLTDKKVLRALKPADLAEAVAPAETVDLAETVAPAETVVPAEFENSMEEAAMAEMDGLPAMTIHSGSSM
jgi:hypothetical protein